MGIYERPDSPYYWMSLERPGRRALQQSTRVRIDAPTTGQRRDNRMMADEIYAVTLGKLVQTGYQLPTSRPVIGFTDFSEWYDTNVLARHRGASKERSRLRRLREYFADRPLHTIDIVLVQEWMTHRLKSVSAASVNRELDDLKLIFGAAVPKYLEKSLLLGFRRLRTKESEARNLTRPEYDRLLEATTTTEEHALIVTGVNTLLRLSSLLKLEWTHDKRDHFVTLNAKVSQVLAPISTVVREALDQLPKMGPFIFANNVGRRGGGPTARENYVIRLFDKLCARANVPHGRHVHGVTFHSLRHTGATWALEKSGNLKAVMQLGGWKTVPQCLKYAHALTPEVQAAAESIAGRRPRILKLQQR